MRIPWRPEFDSATPQPAQTHRPMRRAIALTSSPELDQLEEDVHAFLEMLGQRLAAALSCESLPLENDRPEALATFEARSRSLLLDTSLSRYHLARLERVQRVLTMAQVLVHLDRHASGALRGLATLHTPPGTLRDALAQLFLVRQRLDTLWRATHALREQWSPDAVTLAKESAATFDTALQDAARSLSGMLKGPSWRMLRASLLCARVAQSTLVAIIDEYSVSLDPDALNRFGPPSTMRRVA